MGDGATDDRSRRIGTGAVVSIIVAVLSAPGFYEAFFDRAEDQAQASADVAYEVLRVRAEAQDRQLDELREDVRELRREVREYLWTPGWDRLGGAEALTEGAMDVDAGEVEEVPTAEPVELLAGLPEDLDELVQQRMREE